MIKKIFVLLVICLSFLINTPNVFADTKGAGDKCNPDADICTSGYFCQTIKGDPKKTHLCQEPLGAGEICIDSDSRCINGYTCQSLKDDPKKTRLCQETTVGSAFGTVNPPDALKGFLSEDPTGAFGISQFLSNLIKLFYSVAAVVLIFMLIWGAFEWLTSGGDKEKIESARKRIINAIIGMLLFAVAFAVIRILGAFSGFKFFREQNYTVTRRDSQGGVIEFVCRDGTPYTATAGTLTDFSVCDH